MAKLLVRWIDNPGVTGTKRFDVIDVREDSVEWGSREGFPTYLRVSLPGVTRAQAQFLSETEWDQTGPLDPDTGRGNNKLTARAWKIKEGNIPPPLFAQIEVAYMISNEYVVPNATFLLGWLEKKIDGSGRGSW